MTKEEKIRDQRLDKYLQDGGTFKVIANCCADVPISKQSTGEFHKIIDNLLGKRVVAGMLHGSDGIEFLFYSDQDNEIYTIRPYHQQNGTVTMLGRVDEVAIYNPHF